MVSTVPILGTQSDLALASSSGAKLTGVIYGDEGVDSDGDGLYNYLKVGVQINVTESGIFRVSISGLISSTGSYISIYKDKSMYLDVGLRVLNVSLYGPTIYLSGLNPANVSQISLYEDWNWLETVSNVPLSRVYPYSEFDPPGASFTGVISDKGRDSDGDGSFDYLDVGVEVNITEAGIYSVNLNGLRENQSNYIGVHDYDSRYFDPGISAFNLSLNGEAIRASGLNPRYVAFIDLHDGDGNFLGRMYDVPLSTKYSYTDFDVPPPPKPPSARLTGNITDEGVDLDLDGLFDYLKVGVEINVTASGRYRISVYGLRNATDGYIDGLWASETGYFDVGIHKIDVMLYGPTIRVSGLNPRHVDSVYLYDEYYGYLDYRYRVPLHREYLYTEFDYPGAFLTGVVQDSGVDSDGDGKFDYLEVGVNLNVTEAGTYRIEVYNLLTSEMNFIWVNGYQSVYLNEGTQTVYVSLNGLTIYNSGLNPRIINTISLRDEKDHILGSRKNILLSREYSYTEFENPPASLTGIIVDNGVDQDGDGFYDYLEIGVQVNVTESGTYQVGVSALKDVELNYIDVYEYTFVSLNIGTHLVNVSLYGPMIYASGRNPRLVAWISLYQQYPNWNYLGGIENIALSREYLYSQFDRPGVVVTGAISDSGVDTDGDGKYNYLELGVEINVTEAGYYTVAASGLLDIDRNYISVYASEYRYFNTGIQVVYLSLDGLQIYRSERNPRYVSYIGLQDQNYRNIGRLHNVPLSREYSYTEFETPSAMFTGTIYDQGIDTDGDGTYNYLVVGLEINVTEAGTYEVYVQGLQDKDNNWISVYGYAREYLEADTHVLNVSLSGITIHLSERNPKYLSYASLRDQNYKELDTLSNVPLSREYSYKEFDPPGAVLTGVIFDQGVDTDEDGTYDYLQIGVEVNVTDPGYYYVSVSRLLDSGFNYIDVYGSNSTYLSAGLQVVYIYLEGPRIYISRLNPRYIDYISLWDEKYTYYDYLNRVPLSRQYFYTEFDSPAAMLTGKIYDRGVDTDGDGDFNYLEIGVEINVTKPGTYTVNIDGLQDKDWNWIWIWGSQSGYMNAGVDTLNVTLSGYRIRASRLNPSFVYRISLYADYYYSLERVPLSREYLYTEFDAPAVLTGVVFDEGLDTDGDGAFNFLEVRVQVNVSDPGNYWIDISGLLDSDFKNIEVYVSKSLSLEAGLQLVNLTLDGPRIHLSQRNPRYVNYISLSLWEKEDKIWDGYWHDSISRVPLSRQYYYTEFDPPGAMLTGKIYDRGVDDDADGFFDWLEVGVELNVTETGNYSVYVWGLVSPPSDKEEWDYPWPYYISVWDSKTVELNVGIRTVNLYLYGPQIYVSRQNPANVSYISVNDAEGYYHSISNIPLSRVYSYTEFDAPFTDVETKFVVYPDGRVALEGTLKHTNMVPKNTGPTATGFFNLTGNEGTAQAQAGLKLTFPPELASQFPLNSTTANMLATYSNGILNLRINSTMNLPPGDLRGYPYYPFGQWPFNATDGTMTLTYSEGILNLEINGNTTLPSIVKSQFPLNSTDLTVVGSYAGNTLDGTITFSVLDDFTFDDVNVDFKGNRTDLTLNGTVTVVFGVPFGGFVIRDSTELQQLIDQLKSTIPVVWNMTGGWLNVTTFDIDYTLLESWGAKVTFEVKVHGDFVRALTYLVSQGRNTELLYPVLDEAYSSAKNGSFFIDYKHDSLKAAVKLTFSYDLKRFVDNALTPPPGTLTYVLASYSMYPALALGDVIFVEPVKNASDIVADPTTGDIIVFRRPDYRDRYEYYYDEIIVHRAINKTFVNGAWYFQTKGDNNWYPDSWTVPEHLVIGKVVRRIPLLGHLLLNLLGYPYYYRNMAVPLWLGSAAFSSIQEASIKLSYSSVDRQFDFKLTLVDKLKALIDDITHKLPESWPPETPLEVKEFFEKLLNTTYASVSSAQFSLTYDDGLADFKATVNIEGDLNREINYVKDLYFQLYRASFTRYNMTIPWQLDFIDQTKLDLSNLKVSAQLGETSFEGRVQGVTITPPRDIINATHFKLERLFNLTAPQYPWQREFPGENQRLRITIEGGSNATHTVTLFRSLTVPEPDSTEPYRKSMVWLNRILSSLKDLVFEIKPLAAVPSPGTLRVTTTPVAGEVFVNGISWGTAPQSRLVEIGTYNVSFGPLAGYRTPTWQLATVYENLETTVTGVYEIEKVSSTISINVDPSSVTVDSDTTITGAIAPIRTNVEVTIQYRPTGEASWASLATVKTDGEGKYAYIWTTTLVGTFELKAVWLGDAGTEGAESPMVVLTVNKKTSIITIYVDPPTATVGSDITISGTITPTKANVDVSILYRLAAGDWVTQATVKTDSQSRYTYTWTTTETGTFEVKSIWIGDENTLPAESEVKAISISQIIPLTGTLTVTTSPVAGEVFVNGTSWGLAPQSRIVDIGYYNISFGPAAGYYTPAWQLVAVYENVETQVSGVYTPIIGTLRVTTTPVAGEIFVNGISWGIAPQSKTVQIGTYNVSFGVVHRYYTPSWKLVTVYENLETTVEGAYTPITGTLTITSSPVSGEVFVNGTSWGKAPQSRVVQIGTYTVSFGSVEGFYTPSSQVATVSENVKTNIEGVYQPLPTTTVAQITKPELVNATNPFNVNAIENAATFLSISEVSHPITIIVRNITEPIGVQPPPGTWKVLGNYVQITVNNTDITVNATIRIYYTLEQLEASGLDENTLKIHYWNATSNQWVPVESHVNKDEHYVWTIISHFSIWVIMGQPPTSTTPLWFLIIGVVLAAVVIAITIAYIRKRKLQRLAAMKSTQA